MVMLTMMMMIRILSRSKCHCNLMFSCRIQALATEFTNPQTKDFTISLHSPDTQAGTRRSHSIERGLNSSALDARSKRAQDSDLGFCDPWIQGQGSRVLGLDSGRLNSIAA